ncbi:glutamate--cysteine ligase 2 [Streptantibioticus ferralitis]|uniref:Putative glutamate--cysteine ligase 2 n=1 Tax=Streptantibioticus ferralitis TaxID=236510 RepID=A0ABT5YVB8_9ACTN|nr:glutamate--cysteine ligase [Streptantibioticus ferralitis]MDF2255544.1 glutamate--cysteine ligase [Streptantibioticus ferralitis]
MRLVGVEEELLLVDPGTGTVKAVAGQVLAHRGNDALQAELQREQLEFATRPCTRLEELAKQIREGRTHLAQKARSVGAEAVALATSPLPADPTLTLTPRYRRMAEAFGLTAHEQLTCGCHIHVEVGSTDEGVAVIDRIRPWLAPLIALSGNSPFWRGRDSSYASYRYQAWGRWPTAGPTELFGSGAAYQSLVRALLATQTTLDEGMIYFDARLSHRYPTVEVRVADVCLYADDTVLLACLVRGLVETAARDWRAGRPPDPVPAPVLRLAAWRASRSGLAGRLLHPRSHTPAPAADVVRHLLRYVTPALRDLGDLDPAEELLSQLLCRGSGVQAQRAAYAERGSLTDVVLTAIDRTTSW